MRNFIFLFLVFSVLLTACAPQAPTTSDLPEERQAAPDWTPPEPEAVFCTADVQECADGSFVSRVPPNCDFEPCPDAGATANKPRVSGESETAESCAAAGGEWQQRFIGNFCNKRASDAGKPCTTGEQCDGECVVDQPDASQGACSTFTAVYGCINLMNDGKVTPVCID